jgi:hypothetical protein
VVLAMVLGEGVSSGSYSVRHSSVDGCSLVHSHPYGL